MKNAINEKMYMDFINSTLKSDGVKVADKANKMALENGSITVKQYSAAARLIAKAFLAQ